MCGFCVGAAQSVGQSISRLAPRWSTRRVWREHARHMESAYGGVFLSILVRHVHFNLLAS